MFVPLLQLTQLSESQRVSFRGFGAQSLVRVNPNAGAQFTSFPNTVVRGVQPTPSAVGIVPSGHLVQTPKAENVLSLHWTQPDWFSIGPLPAGQLAHFSPSAECSWAGHLGWLQDTCHARFKRDVACGLHDASHGAQCSCMAQCLHA